MGERWILVRDVMRATGLPDGADDLGAPPTTVTMLKQAECNCQAYIGGHGWSFGAANPTLNKVLIVADCTGNIQVSKDTDLIAGGSTGEADGS